MTRVPLVISLYFLGLYIFNVHAFVVRSSFMARNIELFAGRDDPAQSAIEWARGEEMTSELDSMLQDLPEEQKYELLVQSYSTRILEGKDSSSASTAPSSSSSSSPSSSSNANIKPMNRIFRLYGEMVQKQLTPSARSCQALLDCASKYCSCDILGKALQLGKASNKLRAFGVINSMLVDPFTTAREVLPSTALPEDDRELEIVLASATAALVATYLALQAGSIFDQGLNNWGTLVFGIVVLLGGVDIALTQGTSLRKAAAGLDRLVLADAEREAHADGAAFLLGYLLGLPSFCYQPDVPESLRMLQDYRESMSIFKQRAAKSLAMPQETADGDASRALAYFVEPHVGGAADTPGLAVGRILVWLLAPVAAEQLRYGKNIVADPRTATRLLQVLESEQGLQGRGRLDIMGDLTIPEEGPDRDALLTWAYYEATTLCKQYGDLLEDVRDFLQTGTSSVGECSLLIEQELSPR